jgi:acetyl-CoA carboxylase biotin carboxyl carrier protein
LDIQSLRDLIQELIKIVEESDITGLSVEDRGVKVEIKKERAVQPVTYSLPPQTAPHQITEAAPVTAAEKKEADLEAGLFAITSPMVGTFYRSPSPESPSYVEVGQNIEAGKVVCIVEAMKLFNEIESEMSGEVVKILVENGKPVEYGQKLMLIKTK